MSGRPTRAPAAPPTRAELARAVADAVVKAPGVARLSPGPVVEVATVYPGGKVIGVRLADTVVVHLVAAVLPLRPVAEAATAACRAVLDEAGDERRVEVVIDDVDDSAFSHGGL